MDRFYYCGAIIKAFAAQPVLCVAALAAALTMAWVPPDRGYLLYPDLRVLALLFCLMAVIAGIQACGTLDALSSMLLRRASSLRMAALSLSLLCFFSAMLLTNDVALLAFVPLTLLVLSQCSPRAMIITLVLETVAANLGSALTPVGNPQNLFLYSAFQPSPQAFFSVTAPITLAGLVLVLAGSLLVSRSPVEARTTAPAISGKRLIPALALFALCLLSVFRLLPYPVVLAAVLLWLAFHRELLGRIDWGLLLTFLCFYIFVGNLGRITVIRQALSLLLLGRELLVSAALSQVISNVPAAVMLSGFTQNWPALLAGVNIGGLGTPIASLASLITLQLYRKSPGARTGAFLAVFSAINLAGLALLLLIRLFIL